VIVGVLWGVGECLDAGAGRMVLMGCRVGDVGGEDDSEGEGGRRDVGV
jgi:hypothetical protein